MSLYHDVEGAKSTRCICLKVVVIDDEPLVSGVLREMLVDLGHVTTCFPSAVEALAALARTPDYDLILCDIQMPFMNGIEFYRHLQTYLQHYTARVLFLTGGVVTPEMNAFLIATECCCLCKPFTRADLGRCIAAISPSLASMVPDCDLPRAA
jgi:CheY-like chemotaxis protein